jgi:hypothetical protein
LLLAHHLLLAYWPAQIACWPTALRLLQLLGGQVEAPREFDELAGVLERLAAPRLRRPRTDM